MSTRRNLAMLIGNGLSIAFDKELLLSRISQEVIARFTAQHPGSDAVAQAMQKIALRAKAENPGGDFESLIGAFGGQNDILRDLGEFAELIKDSRSDVPGAIHTVRNFLKEVRRRGIGHTLEIISERSYSDGVRRQPLADFFNALLAEFRDHVTIANLNYDTLILSVLADQQEILTDMARGGPGFTTSVGGMDYPSTWRLRQEASEFLSFEQRRLRLLHLHGSLTYWQLGPDCYRKLKVESLRGTIGSSGKTIWQRYRDGEMPDAFPLVVLTNQDSKSQHVTWYPYNLAYHFANGDFIDADRWMIVGYSFRDACVNDLLRRSWNARSSNAPRILVVTHGDELTSETVEHAFGWDPGTWADHRLEFVRGGVSAVTESTSWTSFTSG